MIPVECILFKDQDDVNMAGNVNVSALQVSAYSYGYSDTVELSVYMI